MTETTLYDGHLKYFRISSVSEVILKTGPGELVEIIASDTIGVAVVHDALDALDGTKVMSIIITTDATPAGRRFKYGIPFTTGLTVDVSTLVPPASFTVIYR